MQYSDTTNKLGLIQECEDLTGLGDAAISGNAANLARFTRWINDAYFKATGAIIQADGRWQWDDSNQTDQPVATGALVEDQRDYSIIVGSPDSTQDWLEIDRVELQDNSGIRYRPVAIDKHDVYASIDERYKVSGTPELFDWEGGSLKVYPSPNYSRADSQDNVTYGFKIWFKRAPLLFASTDTTKKPGFTSLYHKYLALEASFSYCITNDMDRANNLKALADEMLEQIKQHYSKRSKFEIPRVSRNTGKLMK